MSSDQNPDRNPQSPDQSPDQSLEQNSTQNPVPPSLPPATGFRALLLKLLRRTIALLEKVITTLEQPGAAEFDRRYGAALGKVREFLPIQINEKLPDWGLSGAIAALVVLFFWTTTSVLFPDRSTPSPQTPPIAVLPETPPASSPEVSPVPDLTTEVPPELPPEFPPELSPPVASLPAPEASPDPPELAPESSSETADTEQTAENPLENPVEIPAPVPELTPEQVLIATIQKQVIEITTGEPEGLIVKIQPNFNESLLKVQVSQDWYSLSPEQQDQIAAGVEARSQSLDFRQLLLLDPDHRLVARKAVVGNGMIILRRALV